MDRIERRSEEGRVHMGNGGKEKGKTRDSHLSVFFSPFGNVIHVP